MVAVAVVVAILSLIMYVRKYHMIVYSRKSITFEKVWLDKAKDFLFFLTIQLVFILLTKLIIDIN